MYIYITPCRGPAVWPTRGTKNVPEHRLVRSQGAQRLAGAAGTMLAGERVSDDRISRESRSPEHPDLQHGFRQHGFALLTLVRRRCEGDLSAPSGPMGDRTRHPLTHATPRKSLAKGNPLYRGSLIKETPPPQVISVGAITVGPVLALAPASSSVPGCPASGSGIVLAITITAPLLVLLL